MVKASWSRAVSGKCHGETVELFIALLPDDSFSNWESTPERGRCGPSAGVFFFSFSEKISK